MGVGGLENVIKTIISVMVVKQKFRNFFPFFFSSLDKKNGPFSLAFFFLLSKHSLFDFFYRFIWLWNPRHAVDILNHESFTSLSEFSVREIISRDSFCAEEVQIFRYKFFYLNIFPPSRLRGKWKGVNRLYIIYSYWYWSLTNLGN